MSKIIIEAIVEAISSKVDGTVSIKIGTQELDSSNAGSLFSLRGKFIKVLLSDSNITTLESELVDSTQLVSGKKNKTPSQRLRAVLFRLSEQQQQEFEQFYNNELEKIITHYKSKLE